MAISPDAINRFLKRVLADPPRCKGMAPAALNELIYNSTGAKYQEVSASRPHQLEGTTLALYMRQSFLFYYMRLGKSKMALDWAAHLKRANLSRKKGLILAHAPIAAMQVWRGQIAAHSHLEACIIKSGAHALDDLFDALESDCDIIVMSRFTMQTLFSEKRLNKKGVPKLYPAKEFLADIAEFFDLAIIDETHFYSDPHSLHFTIAAALIEKCQFRLGLTGTPVGRDPFAIWSQAFLIDGGKRFGYSYYFFEQAFGKRKRNYFSGRFEYAFDKAKMDLFQYRLDSFSLSYGKGEVKSAEVFSGQIDLSMTPDQKKAYNDAVTKMVKLSSGEEVELRAIFHRLRQIASGYLPFQDADGQSRILHFDSAKLAWLLEFASEAPADSRCLIFHEYVHTGELICKALREARISHSWLYGGAKDKAGELAAFKSGKARWMVANAATGGTAIDLPEADYLCFFESPVSPITRGQAAARPMARGDRPLILDDLVCAPIEGKILGYIAEGDSLLSKLLAGGGRSAKELFA